MNSKPKIDPPDLSPTVNWGGVDAVVIFIVTFKTKRLRTARACVVCVSGHVTWRNWQANRWTQSWTDPQPHTHTHTLCTLDSLTHMSPSLSPLTHYFIALPVSDWFSALSIRFLSGPHSSLSVCQSAAQHSLAPRINMALLLRSFTCFLWLLFLCCIWHLLHPVKTTYFCSYGVFVFFDRLWHTLSVPKKQILTPQQLVWVGLNFVEGKLYNFDANIHVMCFHRVHTFLVE